MNIFDIKCCGAENPIGVGRELNFSWKTEGFAQQSYIVTVNGPDGEPVFSTGRRVSAVTATDTLRPKQLRPMTLYTYTVTSEGKHNTLVRGGGRFETTLFFDETPDFITSDHDNPVFIRRFTVKSPVTARAVTAGLGYYYIYINGKRVGEDYYLPAKSDYHLRENMTLNYPLSDKFSYSVYYNTDDITEYLTEGENTVEVMLGGGSYCQELRRAEGFLSYGKPRLFMSLMISDAGGTREIRADESWLCCAGPSEDNSIYRGERFDSSVMKRIAGGEAEYSYAIFARRFDTVMRPQLCPRDRVERVVTPLLLRVCQNGYIYDCGENLTGALHITGRLADREELQITYSEELGADGLDYTSTGGNGQIQRDVYIGNGDDFDHTFLLARHGFRYFMANLPINAEALIIHTDVKHTGSFECSDKKLNLIVSAFERAYLSNLHGGLVSDCPHREQLGYTGDGQLTAEAALLLFDAGAFYEKWMRDIADGQCAVSGHVQHTAPFNGGGGGPGGWGGAIVFLPYILMLRLGCRRVCDDYFPHMERWMEYLATRSEDHVIVREEKGGWCLGDWGFPHRNAASAVSERFVNTCLYAAMAGCMARISQDSACADRYTKLKDEIIGSIIRNFYDTEAGLFDGKPQGCVFAHMLGIDTPESRMQTLEHYRSTRQLDTGMFATPLLFSLLCDMDEPDLAISLLTEGGDGSFEYLAQGRANTLWEYNSGDGSHNHHMFGAVVGELMRRLSGIPLDLSDGSGAVFAPVIPQGLSFARAETEAPGGRLAVRWQKNGSAVDWEAEIPSGMSATLRFRDSIFVLKEGYNKCSLTVEK